MCEERTLALVDRCWAGESGSQEGEMRGSTNGELETAKRGAREGKGELWSERRGARDADERWHMPVTGRKPFVLAVLDSPDVQGVGGEE